MKLLTLKVTKILGAQTDKWRTRVRQRGMIIDHIYAVGEMSLTKKIVRNYNDVKDKRLGARLCHQLRLIEKSSTP